MLRGKVEGEMVLLSEGSSVKESPEDKQASAPCVRGSAKISWRVTLALYSGRVSPPHLDLAGYPPRCLPHGILGNVAKHYGILVPP